MKPAVAHLSKLLPLLLVTLVGLRLFQPACVLACSCAFPDSARKARSRAAAVFSGKVLAIDAPTGHITSSADPLKVFFDVTRVWKGPRQQAQVITTVRSSGSCGYEFVPGQEYLVYARVTETGFKVDLCSGTKPLAQAGEDIAQLGPGVQVTPNPPANSTLTTSPSSPATSLTDTLQPFLTKLPLVTAVIIVTGIIGISIHFVKQKAENEDHRSTS